MNFGAARLGFWFLNQGTGFNPPPFDNPFYYWSSNQLPAIPGSYAEMFFNPTGTVSVTTNSPALPLFDLPLTWKQNAQPGSSFELQAYLSSAIREGDAFFNIFDSGINTPAVGQYTSSFNLGTTRSIRIEIPPYGSTVDYCGIVFTLYIRPVGSTNSVFAQFAFDIGII